MMTIVAQRPILIMTYIDHVKSNSQLKLTFSLGTYVKPKEITNVTGFEHGAQAAQTLC